MTRVVELELVIEIDSDPISGSLTVGGRPEASRFTGWIELVAAIEAARVASPLPVVVNASLPATASDQPTGPRHDAR